jgi:hypothetical protein
MINRIEGYLISNLNFFSKALLKMDKYRIEPLIITDKLKNIFID